MSKGNTNTYGNKKVNFPYQQSVLLLLGALEKAATASASGLAQESTLISVLNAIVASDQDIEILLVRDTGNGDKVVQQITNYETGVPVVIYKDVNGALYIPVGPLEYLDPSAVLNLILTQLQVLNAGGQLLTEATFTAEDFATESTLGVVNTNLSTINTNVQLGNIVLGNLLTTLTSVVRTPSLQRISGVAAASIAAGARSASFFNAGLTDATVAGGTLKPGESISFDAGGQGDTLGAIPYVTIATGDLVITTIT